MPGILPMKVIKVGTSSQSRIAQACDRCRSKKIRCDGIRPTCTQCSSVGFECKTSDKLSRRAFPRGYTESLEERVRQLESEVRDLKDLLDEKDEKIDMLSRMHSHSQHHRPPSVGSSASPKSPTEVRREVSPAARQDVFRVQATPLLLGVENSDSYFMGPSSGRAFIETFKRKIQEAGKPCGDFNPEAFLHIQGCYPLVTKQPSQSLRRPPRMFSDRCVNIYFQEWAPLFPVLHKPTFLEIYNEFSADSDKVKNSYKVAQLYLVFSIAALSSRHPDYEQIAACEVQWQRALDNITMDNTMNTLQCLVLAIMYCTIRADYKRLQHYKAVAVGLSLRLGLHQSQKRFTFGALTIETRKKVFWTLYSLDCFSAAMLGLPKLLNEDDIHAEYPSDTDDEYVTEKGFKPTLPGEYTRISSALALFRLSRILARVLEKNYPAATTHELSLQQISILEAELQEWSDSLPTHLKLNFVQDKPSTDITGSRSPILALAYYHIRTLIHRPAIGSTLGAKDSPALLATADSSKHIIQIIELLEERNMSFSFCLNKTNVLVLCGMSLLYQSLGLKNESKLMKETERLVNVVLKFLQDSRAAGLPELKRVARTLILVDEPAASKSAQRSPGTMGAPLPRTSPTLSSFKKNSPYSMSRSNAATMSETDLLSQQEKLRRMTMPSSTARPELYRTPSRASFDHHHVEQPSRRDHRFSISQIQQTMMRMAPSKTKSSLDYLSFPQHNIPPASTSPIHNHNQIPSPQQRHHSLSSHHIPNPNSKTAMDEVSISEWEAILGAMDGNGVGNLHDAIYGGPALALETPTTTAVSNYGDWSPDSWDLSILNIGELGTQAAGPQSVLSLSDESLSSADERTSGDFFLSMGDEFALGGQGRGNGEFLGDVDLGIGL
ncbi:fungal-specific transcription factor domain-containing protein [Xylariaceae sp. FL1019]|nr:fungal-specific transcription factor domain-containing protein [Xylariaceae sp. FL1019]